MRPRQKKHLVQAAVQQNLAQLPWVKADEILDPNSGIVKARGKEFRPLVGGPQEGGPPGVTADRNKRLFHIMVQDGTEWIRIWWEV